MEQSSISIWIYCHHGEVYYSCVDKISMSIVEKNVSEKSNRVMG